MPGAHPFKKLHGLTRQHYTGGMYDMHSLSHYVGHDRYGSLYPFLNASPHKPKGMKSPAGPGIGIDHLGVGG